MLLHAKIWGNLGIGKEFALERNLALFMELHDMQGFVAKCFAKLKIRSPQGGVGSIPTLANPYRTRSYDNLTSLEDQAVPLKIVTLPLPSAIPARTDFAWLASAAVPC